MVDGTRGPVRADARRNRQRLIDAALRAFSSADGSEAALEGIARDAGVGIGTLYRHFPSREALIEAVYHNELTRLCDEAAELLEEMPPERALRTWMGRYADFVATKRGMAEALRVVIASGAVTSADTRKRLNEAVRTMLDAGIAADSLCGDVPAEDVTTSMAGVLLVCQEPDQREQIGRLLDLLLAGLLVATPRGTPQSQQHGATASQPS